MSLPLSTTTVTLEHGSTPEPNEGTTYTVYATGVACHVSTPSGSERVGGAGVERIDAVLLIENTAVARGDRVTDEETGEVWERVSFASPRRGLGLDHVRAGLVRTKGRVPA